MDTLSKEARSKNMAKIKGKDTKPELIVRKWLYSLGFRYRKNCRFLPGQPDIVLPKYGVVIFVNGCFWHCHDCKAGRIPKTNTEFWLKKMEANKARDVANYAKLNSMGWKVLVIWECEIMDKRSGVLLCLVEDIIGE